MVECSQVNVKLSDTQLKKIKNSVKNKTGTTLRMSFKMFNGKDLPHELLLTTRQKTEQRNVFNNNMWTDLKLSKAQISKTIQSEEFLGSLLSKLAGPLMKVSIPIARNLLAPLGITKIMRIHGSGTTTLIISNDEINDMMKIVQALEDSNILLKGVTKTIKNKTKEPKGGFLNMLLGTLGAGLLVNLLSGKEIVRAGSRNKKGKGIVRAGSENKKRKGIGKAGSGCPWDF